MRKSARASRLTWIAGLGLILGSAAAEPRVPPLLEPLFEVYARTPVGREAAVRAWRGRGLPGLSFLDADAPPGKYFQEGHLRPPPRTMEHYEWRARTPLAPMVAPPAPVGEPPPFLVGDLPSSLFPRMIQGQPEVLRGRAPLSLEVKGRRVRVGFEFWAHHVTQNTSRGGGVLGCVRAWAHGEAPLRPDGSFQFGGEGSGTGNLGGHYTLSLAPEGAGDPCRFPDGGRVFWRSLLDIEASGKVRPDRRGARLVAHLGGGRVPVELAPPPPDGAATCTEGLSDEALRLLLERGARLRRVMSEPAYAPPDEGPLFEFKACVKGDRTVLSVEPTGLQIGFAFAADWLSAKLLDTRRIGTAIQNGLRSMVRRAVGARDHRWAKDLVHMTRAVGRAVDAEEALQIRQVLAPGSDRIQKASVGKLARILQDNGGDLTVSTPEALQLYREFTELQETVDAARERFLCGLLREESAFLREGAAGLEALDLRLEQLRGKGGCPPPPDTAAHRARLEAVEEERRKLSRLLRWLERENQYRREGTHIANEGRWTLEWKHVQRFRRSCGL